MKLPSIIHLTIITVLAFAGLLIYAIITTGYHPKETNHPKVVAQKAQHTETKTRHRYNPILKRMAPTLISFTNYKLTFTDSSSRMVGPDQYHFTEVGDTIYPVSAP